MHCDPCRYVCKPDLGHPFLTTGQINGQPCTKMAADGAVEDCDGQEHNLFMVRLARVWFRAFTVQLVPGGNAAIQCFNSKQIALSSSSPRERFYKLTCS